MYVSTTIRNSRGYQEQYNNIADSLNKIGLSPRTVGARDPYARDLVMDEVLVQFPYMANALMRVARYGTKEEINYLKAAGEHEMRSIIIQGLLAGGATIAASRPVSEDPKTGRRMTSNRGTESNRRSTSGGGNPPLPPIGGSGSASPPGATPEQVQLVSLLRGRWLSLAQQNASRLYSSSNPRRILLDTNISSPVLQESLKKEGYEVHTLREIFGDDPGHGYDYMINAVAKSFNVRVVTNDKGGDRDGFGSNAIRIPRQKIDVKDYVRFINEFYK